MWKDLFQKTSVGIFFVNEYVFPIADRSAKFLGLAAVQIDQVKLVERGRNSERIERAARNKLASSLRYVLPSPSKRIYIDVFSNRCLSIHDFRVGARILANNVELHFRPVADFIVLEGFHAAGSRMRQEARITFCASHGSAISTNA